MEYIQENVQQFNFSDDKPSYEQLKKISDQVAAEKAEKAQLLENTKKEKEKSIMEAAKSKIKLEIVTNEIEILKKRLERMK